MENIIRKAIEGGFVMKNIILKDGELYAFGKMETQEVYNQAVLNPLFWQALSKACNWEGSTYSFQKDDEQKWITFALKFHEINLTEDFDKAIKYLEDLIK